MRPKRIVLLVDADEQSLSVRRFLLFTRGYKPLTASSVEEAVDVFRHSLVDLVVADLNVDAYELAKLIKSISSETPVLLISSTARALGELPHDVDGFLGPGQLTHVELIERLRFMTARKRGPKPVRPVAIQELVG